MISPSIIQTYSSCVCFQIETSRPKSKMKRFRFKSPEHEARKVWFIFGWPSASQSISICITVYLHLHHSLTLNSQMFFDTLTLQFLNNGFGPIEDEPIENELRESNRVSRLLWLSFDCDLIFKNTVCD